MLHLDEIEAGTHLFTLFTTQNKAKVQISSQTVNVAAMPAKKRNKMKSIFTES
jgi:hypothetical protein